MIIMTNIKAGDLVSTTRFLKVNRRKTVTDRPVLEVTDVHNGLDFEIRGQDLVNQLDTANDFDTTEQISKTDLAKKLTESYNVVFSVCFDKANGEERILRGRLMKPEPLLGRSHCEDLEIEDGHKLRLVDHRTLKWMIVNGVKYTVK